MDDTGIHIIQDKLNEFVRRYYLQELYQGTILLLASLASLWLFFSALAFTFFLSTDTRFALLVVFLTTSSVLFFVQVLIPLAKLLRLKSGMSDAEASMLVGKHFANTVDDKLVNAINLHSNNSNNELVLSSINQKAAAFETLNFLQAIPYKKLKVIGKIAIVPAVLIISFLLWRPAILAQGTSRIIAFEKEFLPENPFSFSIVNKNLSGLENEEFELQIQFLGNELPQEAYIEILNANHRLKQESLSNFSYTIHRLQSNAQFRIKTGIHYSQTYNIEVLNKPQLKQLQIVTKEPAYLGGKEKTIEDVGDFTVFEGTKITWKLNAEHTDNVTFVLGKDTSVFPSASELQQSLFATQSTTYSINLLNAHSNITLDYNYDLEVVLDEYPSIVITQTEDSLNPGVIDYVASLSDDHGVSSFTFEYSIDDSTFAKELPFDASLLDQKALFSFNFYELHLQEGQELVYYFKLSDNDGVNGPKSSFTDKKTFNIPGKEKVDSLLNDKSEQLKNLMASAMSKSQDLQKEYKDIKKLLLEKKSLSWQEQQKISSFLQNQKSFEKDILKLQQENKNKNAQEDLLSPKEKELAEKQKLLDKLFDELLDDEAKKMFEELQKLLDEANDKNKEKTLEKINLNNENLEKSLDRTIELFKQMEFEQELDKTIKELNKLADDLKKLAEQTKESKKSERESIRKEQEKKSKELKRLQEKIEALKKKNNELEQKNEFKDTNEEQKQASDALEKSKEELNGNRKKKAAKQQQKAGDEVKKMAQKMAQMEQKMDQSQDAEDLATTRQLLENLVYLSLEQEKLLTKTKELDYLDPLYVSFAKQQRKLKDDAETIEDSLFALSKRQLQLSSFINKEIHQINHNIEKSIAALSNRKSNTSAINQQYVMTSANNLALILDESIQNMQESMMKKKNGSGSCNKPGGSNPKPGSDMKSLKNMLSKQLEQMKKQLKNGSKPGKSGKKGKNGAAMSFGKMAAQQGEMKQKLKQLNQKLQQQGKGGLGNAKQLENELEKTEKELLNKNITPEMIFRHQEILTKLLESEKAMQEREFEEKRESNKGSNTFIRNPNEFLEYNKTKLSNEEVLKIVLPSLNLFYKKKVNEYFNATDK